MLIGCRLLLAIRCYTRFTSLDLGLIHVFRYTEVVLAGCSAGGMACYLKCDYVASYFAARGNAAVKCICDAGMFLDVPTVTGAGNVMQVRPKEA